MNVRHDMVTVFVVRPAREAFEFLQLRRARNDYMGGTWQIVRGGADPSETFIAAALRELREETGLVPQELYRVGVESFFTEVDDTLWHSVALCALVSDRAEPTLNQEHDASRWISAREIESQTMWPSERSLLRDIFHDILSNSAARQHLKCVLPQSE